MKKKTHRTRNFFCFRRTKKQPRRRKRERSFGGYFKLIIRRWK